MPTRFSRRAFLGQLASGGLVMSAAGPARDAFALVDDQPCYFLTDPAPRRPRDGQTPRRAGSRDAAAAGAAGRLLSTSPRPVCAAARNRHRP